jgi:hypothetical protein
VYAEIFMGGVGVLGFWGFQFFFFKFFEFLVMCPGGDEHGISFFRMSTWAVDVRADREDQMLRIQVHCTPSQSNNGQWAWYYHISPMITNVVTFLLNSIVE